MNRYEYLIMGSQKPGAPQKVKKYRIIKHWSEKEKEAKYTVDKKVLWFWRTQGDYNEYGSGDYIFKTLEEAEHFIEMGCNLNKQYKKIEKEVEIPV